ncbi:hypothetical protein IMSAGC019_01054 [Lachnospiraceae bacterium]|nr:hypothetical protein IMSAGC019_01054 [Lachnospiraceae bacterium]
MTKYVKEIWIQFTDNETYSENEEKLFELLDKAQGECEVKVFIQSTKSYKPLGGYSFNDARLSLLTDTYGEENVRLTTNPVRVKSRSDIIECCGNCIERIADALERIADALEGGKQE